MKLKSIIGLFIFVICYAYNALAQEGLRELHGNITLSNKELHPLGAIPKSSLARSAAGMQIPFKDDFYYASTQAYPDFTLWQDSNVFINTGFPIAPPSIGVATFDGLNKYGYPYTPNLTNMNQSLPADQLTSQAINLKTAGSTTLQASDSVAISFFYQARGRGENPELNDSLVLDFYKPNQGVWQKRMWFSRGNSGPNVNDTIFKKGFVWISDTAFLQENFMFRFRNTATTAGDFDHWHLDYVYLDKLRTQLGDSSYNDIAIGYVPTSFLKNYSAMPLKQYTSSEKALQNTVFIRNNNLSAPEVNTTYENRIYDNTNNVIYSYYGGAHNLEPFKYKGWDPLAAHAKPSFTLNDFPSVTLDSVDYTIKHFLSRGAPSSSDFSLFNDTVIQYQKFRNYFAFDDGSAEGGYYVLGSGGKMAEKIKVNVGDTLRALRIYFDPVGNYNSTFKFRIHVWGDAGGFPSTFILHTDSAVTNVVKHYSVSPRGSQQEYVLQHPVYLAPGTYYIGFQQYVASGITVGFDRNTNHSDMLWFDSGNGWTQSSIYGSLMMRPVFGSAVPAPVSVNEHKFEPSKFLIYPNPAENSVRVDLDDQVELQYKLYTNVGQKVSGGWLTKNSPDIDLSTITTGLYFLHLEGNGKNSVQKLIVRH